MDTPHLALTLERHSEETTTRGTATEGGGAGGGGGGLQAVYVLRKVTEVAPCLAEVRRHQRAVRDRWFTEEAPFLTPERAAALRASFAATGAGAAGLGLEAAHRIMFSDEEREELTLDFFLSDVEAFTAAMARPDRMTLEEMLRFLAENQ